MGSRDIFLEISQNTRSEFPQKQNQAQPCLNTFYPSLAMRMLQEIPSTTEHNTGRVSLHM